MEGNNYLERAVRSVVMDHIFLHGLKDEQRMSRYLTFKYLKFVEINSNQNVNVIYFIGIVFFTHLISAILEKWYSKSR